MKHFSGIARLRSTACFGVFPNAVAPVFADWFSGELHYLSLKFYWGKCVSECQALEAASVMHVERGVLTSDSPQSSTVQTSRL